MRIPSKWRSTKSPLPSPYGTMASRNWLPNRERASASALNGICGTKKTKDMGNDGKWGGGGWIPFLKLTYPYKIGLPKMGSHLPTTIFAGGYISCRGWKSWFSGLQGRTPTQTPGSWGKSWTQTLSFRNWWWIFMTHKLEANRALWAAEKLSFWNGWDACLQHLGILATPRKLTWIPKLAILEKEMQFKNHHFGYPCYCRFEGSIRNWTIQIHTNYDTL